MSSDSKSLQEAIIYFSNIENCIAHLVAQRWPDGVIKCPTCGNEKVNYRAHRRTWTCSSHHAKREFSIKVGTMMEDSPLGLDKWLTATWLLTNCKNGVSSYEIARDVRVSQKSAWFMLHRIRLAMQDDFFGSKLGGEVEADETLSAVNPATCMSANASDASLVPTEKTRPLSWECWSAVGRFALSWCRTASELPCRPKSASMSRLARLSTPTRSHPIADLLRNMLMRLSITLSST